MPRRRPSTSTLAGEEFVPWLACTGELAYSPHFPPERDYFFQYTWVMPGIFCDGTSQRRHFWFGGPQKDGPEVRLLFAFWNKARSGELNALYIANGKTGLQHVSAPLAVYRHAEGKPWKAERLIMIQHGSYLITDVELQPYIDRGETVLYRGIQEAELFSLRRLTSTDIRRRLMSVHANSLADSVTSFNAAHCNVSRTETGCFYDRSFLLEDLCRAVGLEPEPQIRSLLYSGYALEEWCGACKFGSNYVKFRTPLTNIRLTTFVCNESEVKVIDPNKLEVIETVGCSIREVCI
jgi:hypothetical protein